MMTASPPYLALPCTYQRGIYLRLDRLMESLSVPDPALVSSDDRTLRPITMGFFKRKICLNGDAFCVWRSPSWTNNQVILLQVKAVEMRLFVICEISFPGSQTGQKVETFQTFWPNSASQLWFKVGLIRATKKRTRNAKKCFFIIWSITWIPISVFMVLQSSFTHCKWYCHKYI